MAEQHALGHTVKLIPPYQVKPFVVGNKNDHNDGIAIAEASRRPKASFVPVKSLQQQDLQSLQRIRELVGHDKQISKIEKELSALVQQSDDYQRLLTIPGVYSPCVRAIADDLNHT